LHKNTFNPPNFQRYSYLFLSGTDIPTTNCPIPNPRFLFRFQCLTAHESSEIISVKDPVSPNLSEKALRCLISAVKLFFWFPKPVLPSRSCSILSQRFLGGGTRMTCRINLQLTHLCILIAGIFPEDRVFSFQGSAEEVHLLPLTPEKTVGREPRENEKAENSFLCLEK